LQGAPFYVVTTWEEAWEHIQKGEGVGIDLSGKSRQEQRHIMRKMLEHEVAGMRPRNTRVMELYR
jgi:hypothetical protein